MSTPTQLTIDGRSEAVAAPQPTAAHSEDLFVPQPLFQTAPTMRGQLHLDTDKES